MKRVESSSDGVLLFEDVPIEEDAEQQAEYLLQISGIPRNQPSHLIQVFIDDKKITPEMGVERSSHAAEFMTYNSPEPEGAESRAFDGAPFAADQGDYEISINISDAMSARADKTKTVDIALTMVGLDGKPLPTRDIEFSKISVVKRSRE